MDHPAKIEKNLAFHFHYFVFSTLAPCHFQLATSEPEPPDQHHRDCLIANYRPKPSPSTSTTAIATGRDVFFASFHYHHYLSTFFCTGEPPYMRTTTQIAFPYRGRTFETIHGHYHGRSLPVTLPRDSFHFPLFSKYSQAGHCRSPPPT